MTQWRALVSKERSSWRDITGPDLFIPTWHLIVLGGRWTNGRGGAWLVVMIPRGRGALVKFGNRNIIRPGRLTLGRAAR